MADVDLITAGLIGHVVGQYESQEAHDRAIREWFESLSPATQARVVPLNPEIAEALMGESNGHVLHGDYMFELPTRRAEPTPADGHQFDGWAYDSNCVQCRRPEHEHRPIRPLRVPSRLPREPRAHIRTGGVFAIGLGMIFNFVGLVLQLPGRALVPAGQALTQWAVVEDED